MSILDKLKKKILGSEVKKEEKQGQPDTNFGISKTSHASILSILKQPLITEKSTKLSKLGKYVFIVSRGSSSQEIKKNVESVYKVKVININTINIKPKTRRLGKSLGTIPGFRKAIVTLEKGQSIDILSH